jgi:hypothetical protein
LASEGALEVQGSALEMAEEGKEGLVVWIHVQKVTGASQGVYALIFSSNLLTIVATCVLLNLLTGFGTIDFLAVHV